MKMASKSSVFELPVELHTDDRQLVTNVLTTLEAIGLCESYKVESQAGYIVVRGVLKPEANEVDGDDMHMLLSVSPSRIERVSVVRVPTARLDIVVRILDCTQRVMVTGMAAFVAIKKRRITTQ